MTISTSTDFKLNRDQVVYLALELCGAKDVEEEVSAAQMQQAVRLLNMMVKAWMADGLHLWTQIEAVVFPVVERQKFTLGTDRAARKDDTVFAKIDGDQSASTTITLDSVEGLAVSDNIGFTVNGALEWTTISSIDTGNVQVTVATAPSDDVVDNDPVYAYTNLLKRPLRVLSGRRRIDGVEVPLELQSRERYNRLTTKDAKGAIVQMYYSPRVDDGELYVWPVMDDTRQTVIVTCERQVADMDDPTSDFDWPQEWLQAITYNLAVQLANVYQAPAQTYQMLKQEADRMRAEVLAFDQELPSLQLTPEWRY